MAYTRNVFRDAPNRIVWLRPNRTDRIKYIYCRSFRVMIDKLLIFICVLICGVVVINFIRIIISDHE